MKWQENINPSKNQVQKFCHFTLNSRHWLGCRLKTCNLRPTNHPANQHVVDWFNKKDDDEIVSRWLWQKKTNQPECFLNTLSSITAKRTRLLANNFKVIAGILRQFMWQTKQKERFNFYGTEASEVQVCKIPQVNVGSKTKKKLRTWQKV